MIPETGKCPTCGETVRIEGSVTKFYVPICQWFIADLKREVADLGEEIRKLRKENDKLRRAI